MLGKPLVRQTAVQVHSCPRDHWFAALMQRFVAALRVIGGPQVMDQARRAPLADPDKPLGHGVGQSNDVVVDELKDREEPHKRKSTPHPCRVRRVECVVHPSRKDHDRIEDTKGPIEVGRPARHRPRLHPRPRHELVCGRLGQDQQQRHQGNHECRERSIVGQPRGKHPERDVGEGCDRRELSESARKKLATKEAAPCTRFHE